MEKDAIEKLFEEFKNYVADNLHLKRVIENSTKYHLEYLNSVDDANWLDNKLINESFLFTNLTAEKKEKFAFRSSNKAQMIAHVLALHNHQLSWLLIWNYELFEKLLKDINCMLSKKHSNFKNEKHLNQILSNFSEVFPEIRKYERTKILGIELRIMIYFISKIRHAVTHSSGLIADENELFRRVISELNKYESSGTFLIDGEDKDLLLAFIDENKICMLDWVDKEEKGFPITYKTLDTLSGCLVSYASLLKDQFE